MIRLLGFNFWPFRNKDHSGYFMCQNLIFPLHFGQVECCLRMLKQFSPKSFEPKALGCVGDGCEVQQLRFGKKCQAISQLMELPIEHQIYDMIDAAGSEGLTFMEVCGCVH